MPNARRIYLSKKFLVEFFELYRKQPCLWNKGYQNYYDKSCKDQALDVLTWKIKEIDRNATKDDTIRKINMYRYSFYREQKRREIRDSSGIFPLYKPRLWYYKHLKFLLCDQPVLLSRQGVLNDYYQVGGGQNNWENHTSRALAGPSRSLWSTTSLQRQPQPQQQTAAAANGLYFRDVAGRPQKDELAAVVESIGNKLKSMPRHKLLVVEKLIDDLLRMASFREVDQFTRINLYEQIPSLDHTSRLWQPAPTSAQVATTKAVTQVATTKAVTQVAARDYCPIEGCCVTDDGLQRAITDYCNYCQHRRRDDTAVPALSFG